MPEISRFFGIVIYMFFNEHQPPHFHARYGEFEAVIGIENLALLYGEFPSRALGLVMEWASLHQGELRDFWSKLRRNETVGKIEPLN